MKNVCIIEDNTSIRKLYCTVLKKAGYETNGFGDAITVLNWLQSNKPDLLIVDILLPDANGTDLLVNIHKIAEIEKVPAIAITGFSTLHDKEKFMAAGFVGYLSKPINTASLVAEVKKIIGD